MPLPTIANTHRVAIRGTAPSGAPWVNVMHFRWVGAGAAGPTQYDLLHAQLEKLYGGPAYAGGVALLAYAKATCTMDGVTYTALDGISASYSKTSALAGTDPTDALSSQLSVVVSFLTALRGRRYRGRVYLPPYNEIAQDATGRLGTTAPPLIQAQFVGFLAALLAASWDHVVATYGKSPGKPDWAPAATSITSYRVDRDFDVQRRRKTAS